MRISSFQKMVCNLSHRTPYHRRYIADNGGVEHLKSKEVYKRSVHSYLMWYVGCVIVGCCIFVHQHAGQQKTIGIRRNLAHGTDTLSIFWMMAMLRHQCGAWYAFLRITDFQCLTHR